MYQRELFERSTDALPIANRAELIARYKQLRMVSLNLNQEMVQRLSRDDLHEGGRKIGMLQRGTLVFESEDESSVLMDYCLYDVRRKGCNKIEQYLIDSPPDPESDEMTCLRAMQHAVYSMYVVESVEPGLGVMVRDLRSNETTLVVDMGFGSTAEPGLVFASRLMLHEGFSMTGGAALPAGIMPKGKRDAAMKMLAAATAPDADGYFDPAPLIRWSLGQGASSHVRYEDAGQATGQPRSSPTRRPEKIGRNAPCPCGSGKKFKHCCINRS